MRSPSFFPSRLLVSGCFLAALLCFAPAQEPPIGLPPPAPIAPSIPQPLPAPAPAVLAPAPVEAPAVAAPAVAAPAVAAPAVATPVPAAAPAIAPASTTAKKTDDKPGRLLSPREILKQGGWPMFVLAFLSFVAITLVIYFFFVLRMRNITPPRFLADIESMITSGRLGDARKACLRNKSPAAAITLAAIEYVDRETEPDPRILIENIESEGTRQATAIQNNLRYLADIAHIAPMVGLLGTVLGMFTAFSGLGSGDATATPEILAAGVAKALTTTAGGLIVGIPALIFYSYFRNKAHRLLSNLEIVGTDLINLLTAKRPKRK